LFPQVVPGAAADSDDSDYSDDDVDVDVKIDRDPVAGDVILITWEGDDEEYLCKVEDAKRGNGLQIVSSDLSFKERLEFNPDEDVWRFSRGTTKAKPKK